LADLARDVAKLDSALDENSHDDVRELSINLYHIHLPKLNEAEVVSFVPETKMASVTADSDE